MPYLLILISFFLDQSSKWFFREIVLKDIDHIKLFEYLNISEVWNTGVSFGMLNSFDYSVLVAISLALSFGLFIAMLKTKSKYLKIGLALIIGGALGNSLDRIIHGAVYDFIDFHINNWHWPAFNFADCSVCIGAGFILLSR